jgi:hypothetical protein
MILCSRMGFVAQIVFRDSYRETRVIALSHEQLDTDLSPKSPPAFRGVLGVKSLALGRHLVHRLSLQKFHRGQVA